MSDKSPPREQLRRMSTRRKPRPLPPHVVEWQAADVHDWLASLTFLTHAAEVANKAEAACISGELLMCLNDATLEELGVASALERLRLSQRESADSS